MEVENRNWQKLEFPKILELLSAKASFAIGREWIERLAPASDAATAESWMAETEEAREILRLYPLFSLGGVRDIREPLKRAELGGVLSISELVDIGDTCRASRQTRDFFSQVKGSFPICCGLGKTLGLYKTIESALEKAITPENVIADTASDRLYNIRRKIKQNQDRVKERLESFIHNPLTVKYLQDPIVTIRGDRYVVPVKQEYRSQVPGIVHDMSASGATLFVEPLGVMEANNDLAKLHMEEEEEISAILQALTMVVVGFVEDIRTSLAILGQLDFIFAKAKLSQDIDGASAKINNKGIIHLKKARHPLISGKVVPVDIKLPGELYAMVITGPNTGGKTVSLKTVGLLTLMALCGLHIPAEKGSEIAYYQNIFADIGDEQSIEQSLSTFSSHMVNIVNILAAADSQSLVLLDELGAGTDPMEGAALAMSILEYLHHVKAKIVATTHYSELKAFAYNKPGFINASVEFDVATLRPTYRLLMGVPGKSNAFEIARKLGIQNRIIERAAALLAPDDAMVSDMITSLENDKHRAEEELREAELAHARALEAERQLKAKEVELANREGEIIRKAQQESLKIIEKAQQESEALCSQIEKEISMAVVNAKAVQEARRKLKKMASKLKEQAPEEKFAGEAPTTVQLGQMVEIPKLHQFGQVLSMPNSNGEVLLQIGVMKVTLKLADLRIDKEYEKKEESKSTHRMQIEKAKKMTVEIDLRGMLVDEAIEALDKYLDDAFIAGLKEVRVIHGKGTGALRQGLQPYFQSHRLIKSARSGGYYDGGIGVTILELDL